MVIKVHLKLMAEDKQPKHSARYGFDHGDAGVEGMYIKRSALPDPPPKNITVTIEA